MSQIIQQQKEPSLQYKTAVLKPQNWWTQDGKHQGSPNYESYLFASCAHSSLSLRLSWVVQVCISNSISSHTASQTLSIPAGLHRQMFSHLFCCFGTEPQLSNRIRPKRQQKHWAVMTMLGKCHIIINLLFQTYPEPTADLLSPAKPTKTVQVIWRTSLNDQDHNTAIVSRSTYTHPTKNIYQYQLFNIVSYCEKLREKN